MERGTHRLVLLLYLLLVKNVCRSASERSSCNRSSGVIDFTSHRGWLRQAAGVRGRPLRARAKDARVLRMLDAWRGRV